MTEKTLTTENIKPALDALRGELAPWPVVAKKQDRLNTAQLNAANSGITSSLVAQIIANTAAIRALESAITGTGLRALVVSSLPAIGTQGILYIVPVTTYDPETDADVVNYSNEYIWIVAPDAPETEGYYEQVGQTGIVINNGQLTIAVNGTSVGTFTANQSGDTTAAITVPTNADYVDLSTNQTIAGTKTFSSTIEGTAAKAIADEDGTSIKTGYGKLAGANVWSGYTTFTNYITSQESAAIPAGGYGKGIAFRDYQNNRFGYIQPYLTSDSEKRLLIGVDSGDIASNSNIIPNANNTVSLGSSSYQWSSVYAQTYYYNGVAWGLDKENTWTNGQTYSAYNYGQMIWLKNTGLDFSVNGNTGLTDTYQQMIHWVDKNNAVYSSIQSWTASSENTLVLRSRYRTDANTIHDLSVRFTSTATNKVVYPETNADTELGTSTNKWKTLNGVNPGALSLPDNSNAINLDTTNWGVSGELNHYAPTINGWLCISVKGGANNGLFLMDTSSGFGQSCYGNANETVAGRIKVALPVIASRDVLIIIHADSNSDIYEAKLYPCLGNV